MAFKSAHPCMHNNTDQLEWGQLAYAIEPIDILSTFNMHMSCYLHEMCISVANYSCYMCCACNAYFDMHTTCILIIWSIKFQSGIIISELINFDSTWQSNCIVSLFQTYYNPYNLVRSACNLVSRLSHNHTRLLIFLQGCTYLVNEWFYNLVTRLLN